MLINDLQLKLEVLQKTLEKKRQTAPKYIDTSFVSSTGSSISLLSTGSASQSTSTLVSIDQIVETSSQTPRKNSLQTPLPCDPKQPQQQQSGSFENNNSNSSSNQTTNTIVSESSSSPTISSSSNSSSSSSSPSQLNSNEEYNNNVNNKTPTKLVNDQQDLLIDSSKHMNNGRQLPPA